MDEALRWLDLHGAGAITHPGGTLRTHLIRVAGRIQAWGLPESVRLAALTHAAYGTAGFDDQLIAPSERADLRAVIGSAAERLVYIYGACDRSTSYPQFAGRQPFALHDRFTGESMDLDDPDTRAFVALTFANEIDVMQHNAALAARHGKALFELATRSVHRLPAAAVPDLALLAP